MAARRMPQKRRPRVAAEARELTLTSLVYGGDALGRLDGRAVFVPLAAPGDRVIVRLGDQHASFARAEVERIVAPSPLRREPVCSLFGTCGGCQWLHVADEAQIEAKQQILSSALRRLPVQSLRIVPAPSPLHYRRRVRLHWRVASGRVTVGWHRHRSRQLVDAEACWQLEPCLEQALQPLRAALGGMDVGGGTAVLLAGVDGQVHASLRVDYGAGLSAQQLIASPVTGAVVSSRSGGRELAGVTSVRLNQEGLLGSAEAFAQANAAQDEVLRRVVVELAALRPSQHVLELFAGVGNLTMALAAEGVAMTVVESERQSAEWLTANIRPWATAVEVRRQDALLVTSELADRDRHFDVVLLDPPREGARDVVALLPRLRPRRVVYVSCDPMTLARDLGLLVAQGYDRLDVVGIDMMPQTFHIETVVCASRSDLAAEGNG